MSFFEKLRQGIFEEIRGKICEFILWDCDWCPAFISSRCPELCNDRNDKETEEGK